MRVGCAPDCSIMIEHQKPRLFSPLANLRFAQNIAPLVLVAGLAVTVNAQAYVSELAVQFASSSASPTTTWHDTYTPSASDGHFCYTRIVARQDLAGGWYTIAYDLHAPGNPLVPDYMADLGTALSTAYNGYTGDNVTSLQSSASATFEHLTAPFEQIVLDNALAEGLRGTSSQLTYDQVGNFFDPIFNNNPTSSNNQMWVEQYFGETANARWPQANDNNQFNLEAMLQTAIWRRVGELYTRPGETEQQAQEAFFNSTAYLEFLQLGVALRFSAISVRGPAVGPLPVGGTPEFLVGFPTALPALNISPAGTVSFSGSAGGTTFNVAFGFGLVSGNLGSLTSPYELTFPGMPVTLATEGYEPRMQVRVRKVGTSPSVFITLPVTWSSPGQIDLTLPVGTAPGSYRTNGYRYADHQPNGTWTYGTWTGIVAGHRATLVLQ